MLEARIEKCIAGFTLRAEIQAGNETLALLGASGAGKSMTLRCLAGVVRPDRGFIKVNGQTWFDSERHIDVRPQERGVGLLFQNYALFPNMTVRQNLLCGLRYSTPKGERKAEVDRLLDTFCLHGLGDRLPAQLSGGQQQRVALARCMARKPSLLLLDEPFAALDTHLRWRLMQDMKDALTAFAGTTLYVTHDREETLTLCDRVCVVHEGRMRPAVSVRAWYHAPQTRSAANLAGFENVLDIVQVEGNGAALNGTDAVWPCPDGRAAALAFRTADAVLASAQRDLALRCRIVRMSEQETVLMPVAGPSVLLRAPAGGVADENGEIWLCVPPERVVWLQGEEP